MTMTLICPQRLLLPPRGLQVHLALARRWGWWLLLWCLILTMRRHLRLERGASQMQGTINVAVTKESLCFCHSVPSNRISKIIMLVQSSQNAHGQTWHTSQLVPCFGFGEAAVVELPGGTLYMDIWQHWAPRGVSKRNQWSSTSAELVMVDRW
jgi:hypothetical protein